MLLILVLCGPLASAHSAANPYLQRIEQRMAELQRLRRTPGGVLALHGLLSELWDRVPVARIQGVLKLAMARDSHPLVRGHAALLAVRVSRSLGREDQALRHARQAGIIPRWFLCGPLPSRRLEGHEDATVEQALDGWPRGGTRHRGRSPVRWVGWRPLPVEQRDIVLSLQSFVGTGGEAVVLLQAVVRSDAPRWVAMRLGTPGPFKVFVNGGEIAARRVTRPAAEDQDVVGIHLGRGVNRLALKLTHLRGAWNVYARLTDPTGGPVSGLSWLHSIPVDAVGARAPAGAAPPMADPASWLKSRGGEDWALYLMRATPVELAHPEVEAALARLSETRRPDLHLLLARRPDPQGQRDEIVAGLKRDPANPWALLELARLENKPLTAARLLGEVLHRHPDFLPAQLELVAALRTVGLEATAASMLERMLRSHPDLGVVLVERANLALAMEDATLADELFRRYLRTNQTDISTLRSLADLALRRADPAAAVRWLRRAVHQAPHLAFLYQELATVHEGMGDVDRAAARYRAAIEIDPDNPTPHEQLGHLLYRAGRVAGAWSAWHRALQIQPQNAQMRAYLAMLAPRRRLGAAERFRQDATALVRRAKADWAACLEPTPPAGCRVPATVLLDATVTQVHDSGLSRTLRQRVVQVMDQAGLARASRFQIPYNPDRQVVEVRLARVHRVRGNALVRGVRREHDLSEPWAGLWYDLKAVDVRFPSLRPGDIVELEYLVEDVAESNLLSDYFGDVIDVQQDLPVRQFRYTLISPLDRQIYVRSPGRRVRHDSRVEGTRRVQWWSAEDVHRVSVEPAMPGWSEVADYIHVSTYSSWPQVGRWYWSLMEQQLKPSRELVRQAWRITAGCSTDGQRIQAVHNFVAKNTRYVGLEFGIHSYKPYSAAQVLTRRFGDCKDKATLIIALLAQVGIRAEMVLVRTRPRGAVDPKPASLAPFDHAIVYVPEPGLYLDATAEFAGTRELPWQDQGVMALHVAPGGATRLVTTPVLGAEKNTTRVVAHLWVMPDGKTRILENRRISGQAAHRWRAYYQSADSRTQRYEKRWNSWVGGASVRWVKMPNLEQLEQPVQVMSEVLADGLARVESPGRITVPPGGGVDTSLVQAYGRLTRRVHPLQLEFPWRSVQRVRITPPAGWRAVAPLDREVTSPFGGYRRRTLGVGGDIEVRQEVWVDQARIASRAYPRFRRFLQQIDGLLSERVVLARP